MPRKASPNSYQNNTSRDRKWVCACATHIIDEARGYSKPGPYIVRMAGTGALIKCEYCETLFRMADEAPNPNRIGRRMPKPCAHCENPEAHTHDEATA